MAMESERRVTASGEDATAGGAARAGENASTGEEGLLVNALVGAVVSVVLAFIPFSPVLGGAVAGYLQKGDDRTGAKVGAISGAIAAIPALVVLTLVFGFLSFITIAPDGVGPGAPLALGALLLIGAIFAVLFSVGLSAVGGFVGVVIARERAESATPAAASGSVADESATERDETDETDDR